MPSTEEASERSRNLRCAAIDIGTNSIKMVVADIKEGVATSVLESSDMTRLGEGMQSQRLWEAPIRRTLDVLEEYTKTARAQGASDIAAVGTAALRDALNRDDFIRRARQRCDVEVEVIPGEEEARLSYLAVRRDPRWRDCENLIVIDVGGGSTEVIHGETGSDRIADRISVNLGAVKLTERFLRSDPPTVHQLVAANQAAAEGFAAVSFWEGPAHAVGVGGTLTNLGAMDQEKGHHPEELHGHTLQADNLDDQIAFLSACTIAERREIPGIDPRRADIILGGAILLSQALARIRAAAVDISTRGLRWGVLYDRFLL